MMRFTTLILCLLASACTSSGHSIAKNEPVEISFFQGGKRQLTLVNEAHTNRLELYSQISESASTKVASDEIMEALVEYFDDNDFFEFATGGGAHESSEGGALVFENAEGPLSLAVTKGSSAKQLKVFNNCRTAFIKIWNSILALQAVRNKQGESIFGKQQPSR